VIVEPVNDAGCLGAVTQVVADLVGRGDPALSEVAGRFRTTRELARWIRSLPQRDDVGAAGDGPRVHACEPPQRLRLPAEDPNCVERSAIYLGAGELIDPRPERRLATIDVPGGRHTLPVENGKPVVLDPRVRRNAARAGLFKLGRRRNGAAPMTLTPAEAITWIGQLAAEPARHFAGGLDRVARGEQAMRALVEGGEVDADGTADIAFVLALAEHEARLFGPTGECIVRTTARAVDELDASLRNGRGVRVGRYRVRPSLTPLSRLARVGGRLGLRVGVAAAREKLAALGVSGAALGVLEDELNREGMSLGPLAAAPPLPGTLAAVTPDAVAGRWLADKLT
jgi:hypothetical protein